MRITTLFFIIALCRPVSNAQQPLSTGVTIDTSAKRLVVKFTFEASADDKVSVAVGAIDPNLVQRVSVVNNRVQVVSLQPNADPSSVKAQLEQVAGVQSVEEDQVVTIGQFTGNDPMRSQQWAIPTIKAPWAWTRTRGSSAIKLCVVDTGLDSSHPDIRPNIQSGARAAWLDGQQYGDAIDENSHGTHVAGIAAAVGNNGIGISGVSQAADILACKFMDKFGNGYLSDATQCVKWCTAQGAKVLVASWGGAYSRPAGLEGAINAFGQAGGLFVGAAMNFGVDLEETPMYPPSLKLPNMLVVGAVDERLQRASYSNWGRTTVHVFAPGSNILSTIPMSECQSLSGCYGLKSGTSMAAPVVAGQALLLMAAGRCSGASCKALIQSTTDTVPVLHGAAISAGVVNCAKAMGIAVPVNDQPVKGMSPAGKSPANPSPATPSPGATSVPKAPAKSPPSIPQVVARPPSAKAAAKQP